MFDKRVDLRQCSVVLDTKGSNSESVQLCLSKMSNTDSFKLCFAKQSNKESAV